MDGRIGGRVDGGWTGWTGGWGMQKLRRRAEFDRSVVTSTAALTRAWTRTRLARAAKRSVESASLMSESAAETQATTAVLQLPPRLCLSSCVSTESRKGTCVCACPPPPPCAYVSAVMTLPSVSRLVLMHLPSATERSSAPAGSKAGRPATLGRHRGATAAALRHSSREGSALGPRGPPRGSGRAAP